MINKVDDEGFTALHLAAQLRPHPKAMDIAKILLCAGADVNIINNHGETSAAVARRCGNESLAYYLETKTTDGIWLLYTSLVNQTCLQYYLQYKHLWWNGITLKGPVLEFEFGSRDFI